MSDHIQTIRTAQEATLTPEQMRERILELAVPVRDFCRAHGIASFLVDDGPREGNHDRAGTMELSLMVIPLPPSIKCTLERYGSIYVVDAAPQEGRS